jgi:hypothetical protein
MYTDRILAKTRRDGDCLIWTGARTASGYGVANWGGKYRYLHRVIFEEANGSAAGDIDHICGNRACVSIAHLRVLTRRENVTHRTVISPLNTSGYPGVDWSKQRQKWRARARLNGHEYHIGFRSTPREAYELWCVWQLTNNAELVHRPLLELA